MDEIWETLLPSAVSLLDFLTAGLGGTIGLLEEDVVGLDVGDDEGPLE